MPPILSLILPYWNRQAAADRALRALDACYRGGWLEVIVVDDGSPEPFRLPAGLALDIKVMRLPAKPGPLSSCLPVNCGVRMACGRYIGLSSIEMVHTAPILERMLVEAEWNGAWSYVMAACWAPESKVWHCHSTNKRGDNGDVGSWLPPGADYHFMSLLSRNLWELAGGLDEAYRDGAGYEDADFVRRLHRARAKFIMRDDLVVEHPRQDARAAWTSAMFERNRAIFLSKWAKLQ